MKVPEKTALSYSYFGVFQKPWKLYFNDGNEQKVWNQNILRYSSFISRIQFLHGGSYKTLQNNSSLIKSVRCLKGINIVHT